LAAADPQAAADRLAQEPGREQTPEVWRRTVLGLFRVGAPERAEAIRDAVHPAWIADGLRANAVECLTEHGRQDVARRLAAAVPVHSVEARAACAAALGDVATVLRLVDAEADPARRLHLLSRVIRPGRRANQVLVPTATHLAEQSQDSAPANVNELAESLLESDLPELAGQLLGGLPTDKINILLLFRAIRAAHAVGRHAQAVTLARLALEVAEPLLFTDKAHNLFVLTLLGAGDRDEAAAHVEAHPRIHWDDKIVAALDKAPRPARPDRAADDDRRGQTAEAQALVVRAQDCLATGDRAQARKYAEAAQATAAAANPFLAARQRQAICQALLAAGKTAEARAVADAIDHRAAGTLRLACRIAVAKSSAQPAELIDLVRQSEDVLEAAVADPAWTATAGPVETLNDVEEALATAVRALVDLGHAGAASRLCRSHPNDWLRYHMVKALVAALQENGHRDHATAWAALLVPADRTAALSAPADGRRDQPDATPASLDHLRSLAHEATSKMPRPPTLPGGFAGLAAECAEAGLIPEAHALMVQALLASAWRAALPVMASHFPEALVRLAQLSEE
jgi:hypothetical protein